MCQYVVGLLGLRAMSLVAPSDLRGMGVQLNQDRVVCGAYQATGELEIGVRGCEVTLMPCAKDI